MVTKLVLGVIGPLLLTEIRLVIAFLSMAPFAARQGFRLKDVFRRDIMLFALTGTSLYYGLENSGMVYNLEQQHGPEPGHYPGADHRAGGVV